MKLKKLKDQVIVITGASSGIGLVTARLAAKQGAKLVLTARSEDALRQLADEITAAGGQAIYAVADVGKEADLQRVAELAIEKFGGFDTWVNNAGVSVYGTLLQVPMQDMRKVFETNLWGVIHGSLIAARHLKDRGGVIINVGSTLSDRAIPIQGIYSASKHAVKGFTDSLRMELELEKAPVHVCLIKPAAIDTPYVKHARNYLDREPKNPPPVYAPDVVAQAILRCATHPQRDVFVGAGGKMISAQGYYAPRLSDKYMEKVIVPQQKSDSPPGNNGHRGLYEPSGELEERGGYDGHVSESSLYTKATMHPMMTALIAVGAGLAVGALMRNGNRRMIGQAAGRIRNAAQDWRQRHPEGLRAAAKNIANAARDRLAHAGASTR